VSGLRNYVQSSRYAGLRNEAQRSSGITSTSFETTNDTDVTEPNVLCAQAVLLHVPYVSGGHEFDLSTRMKLAQGTNGPWRGRTGPRCSRHE
jgi:hypothetical protein